MGAGKGFIIAGAILILIGVLFSLGPKMHWLGRLPGDILIKKENFTFYFPLTTSLLVSFVILLVSILLLPFARLFQK